MQKKGKEGGSAVQNRRKKKQKGKCFFNSLSSTTIFFTPGTAVRRAFSSASSPQLPIPERELSTRRTRRRPSFPCPRKWKKRSGALSPASTSAAPSPPPKGCPRPSYCCCCCLALESLGRSGAGGGGGCFVVLSGGGEILIVVFCEREASEETEVEVDIVASRRRAEAST